MESAFDDRATFSMLDILLQTFTQTSTNQTYEIKAKLGKETRYVQLQYSKMMLDRQEHFVATFHDMTESKRLQQAQGQNTLLSLLTSSVSHEMVTPLKCIISFANNL